MNTDIHIRCSDSDNFWSGLLPTLGQVRNKSANPSMNQNRVFPCFKALLRNRVCGAVDSLRVLALLVALSHLFDLHLTQSHAGVSEWSRVPSDWRGATFDADIATLSSRKWSYLQSGMAPENVEVSTTITIREPGKHRSYFGETWSVWPSKTVDDEGWDAGLLLCANETSGYRIQISSTLGEVALVKFPAGGYVQSVPIAIRKDTSLALSARVHGNRVTVSIDGREILSFLDASPLAAGKVGIGVHSGAKVEFSKISLTSLGPKEVEKVPDHSPNFRVRQWIGGRQWVFDGDEPILLLPHPDSSFINNVKLRPGIRPLLGFNSHWDVQAQGAYAEAKNDTVDLKVDGGGGQLVASWMGRHEKNRFSTRSRMTVGWDPQRSVYTYDIESNLEVLPGEPFDFRQGFDFEHHTPLDPFNWQYLVFRKANGTLQKRPVYPVDPGVQEDLGMADGLKVWHGRHNDPVPVCPAVEYRMSDTGGRKVNTAVCAAFYDTGVAFPRETLKPAQKVSVRYRYTGYPSAEAERLFNEAKTVDSPMLDPDHHYIFAEWPKTTFAQFAVLSDSWIYGRVPFMSGHNRRPTYELAKVQGTDSGHAIKLGPMAFGSASMPLPSEGIAAGRYLLSVKAMGENLIGPGGRIELTAADKSGKPLMSLQHYVGAGTFGWRQSGLVFDLPTGVKTLSLGFGNGGTGSALFADAEFKGLKPGEPLPEGIAATANPIAAKIPPSPEGSIMDYRMVEGRGLHTFDFAGGPLGVLELANAVWVTDEGRPALKFVDYTGEKGVYPKAGVLDSAYLRHPGYKGRDTVPVAVAGHHGGDGFPLKGFTMVSWVKPAPEMGKSEHSGYANIVGIGARRLTLRLLGQTAPYQLMGLLDNNDQITSKDVTLEAGRWYQVAMTGEPTSEQRWRIGLYLDSKQIQESTTQKFLSPAGIPPSVILGAELFYFHNAYYRGLIGRTLLFDRPLNANDLSALRAAE